MSYLFQLRRGTAAQWEAKNPVLRDGEPGLETDTGRLKAGDGGTAWTDLPYVDEVGLSEKADAAETAAALATKANAATVGALSSRVDTTETRVGTVEDEVGGRLSATALSSTLVGRSEVGAAGGVAPLGSDGKVPSGNLPPGLGGGSSSTATAIIPLSVPTYDYRPGVGHPDVLHIPGGWNGYAYWMAFTPLPGTTRENPSIVASNDGISWVVPTGLTNPLFTLADAVAMTYDYWADTDLVLSPDGTTLMLYFKGTRTGVRNEYLLTTSTNGTTWTPASVVVSHAEGAAVSPAVVVEDDDTFSMFEIKDSTIARRTSANGSTWSAAALSASIPTLPAPYNLWHIDVTKVGGTYHALVMATTTTGAGVDPFRLFHWTSTNGSTWAGSIEPAVPLTGGRYDKGGHYRSAIQPAASGHAGKFDIWTSCIDDTRLAGGGHTAAVWRLGHIKDFDFSDGETWAFPEPPLSEFDPLNGDEVYYMAPQLTSHTGTATLANLLDTKAWAMSVDDYLTVTAAPLPKGWHRFAVDILLVNPTTNGGDVQFQGHFYQSRPGQPLVTGASGYLGSTITKTMPATQYDMTWMTLTDGSQSALDLGRNTLLTVKIRRRGGPANTYGTVDKPHILAVRFRRV